MKKALIFDPYLDTLGGGERYTLSFALDLVENGYDVEIAWSESNILEKATSRFGLDFSSLRVNSIAYEKCRRKISLIERFLFTKDYDLIFWVSDGSLPFLFSKRNLIHFQVPFVNLGGDQFTNNLKSIFVNKFIYNSQFTRSVLEKHLDNQKSFVLYPPIDINKFTPGIKENQILSVARFGSPLHSKRQDVLIEAFRKLSTKVSGYRLVLTGGIVGDLSVLEDLKKQAEGLFIEIIPNPDFNKLKELYATSKFFWHAAGYGIDEEKDPEKVEHFGMTTVEAMASGCVPLVIAKGGQKEIIVSNTGFLCKDEVEIADKTAELIANPDLLKQNAEQSIIRSQEFTIIKFNEKIKSLI
jgi:glycosyltransferase involved in cell wall biosynthesis